MKKRVWRFLIIGLVNFALIIIGFIYNTSFFEISLSTIVSLNVTLFVSVLFVQELTSRRRRYDYIVTEINSIYNDIIDVALVSHSDGIKSSMLQKSVANRIHFITIACKEKGKDEIKYIEDKFDEIRTYYGDHAEAKDDDPYYQRIKTDIKDKIVKLKLILYGFEIE